MDKAVAQRGTIGHGASAPALTFALLAFGLTVLLAVIAAVLLPGAGVLAGPAVLVLVAGFGFRGMAAGYNHPRLGACNVVTLVRAALTAGLVAALVTPGAAAWGVVAVAVVALALDGVDGWLARREGLVSDFGARFDMEVDALLALVLALLALAAGKVGPWVLVLGGLRYVYVAAGVVWPWLRGNLPPRAGRKTVCVIQMATLIALIAPPVAPLLSLWLAAGATALLVWSFAADILWLWRRR